MPKSRPGIQVVIIDDNASEAHLLVHALRTKGLGHDVVHFESGREALEWLFAEGEYGHRQFYKNPRLVLLDINMPQMSGIDVLSQIRANVKTSQVPVVMLTASREEVDLDAAYARGANAYVVKPINYDEFSHVVDGLAAFWKGINVPPTTSA